MIDLVAARGTIRGMLVGDHGHLRDRFLAQAGGWLASGALRYRETIVDGLESAPQAFIELLQGANTGKMLVRVGS
jgi:NADPH-dependent curcumin reductase CurA